MIGVCDVMTCCAFPTALRRENQTQKNRWFLREGHFGTISQYFANYLQLFWHKYSQLRHTNICNCSGANIWMADFYRILAQISHLQRGGQLGRTSPSQGELFHPESSNVSNGWRW